MASILQTEFWADFKSRTAGWQPLPIGRYWGLKRRLPLGQLAYFPELPFGAETLALATAPELATVALARLEFLEEWDLTKTRALTAVGLRPSFEEVQPNYRQWLDLTLTEPELLAGMRPKGRYNLNLALRQGLTVKAGLEPILVEDFLKLYQLTSSRQRFRGRGSDYFRQLATLLQEHQAGEVIVVYYQNWPLAAGYFTYFDQVASYLYGASSDRWKEMMGPYLLHWQAILRAKSRHCRLYDLLAIAPPGQPTHRHGGLTRFKSQFGGRSVRLVGSWDLVNNRTWYTLYRLGEKLRRGI
ncbi:MAG: peptidoglycan bridge formation glycyltransferase FemA/FemB family protein [Patescibacteria group bacterium]